ncbi:hypothetical protein BU24DRAFT_410655 [Aaosphaeria arxii CBS 175.79]|uniref:Uncharacterized protein n=1 Tax=Aaosphaeria arxii CBS 175.79 TaxID=1450172 RepID=A0A6A5XNY0_9PLEO|nr:uncharacterized protein BU24DRAFT_410655 [Aaosphaeria arxii CBS 175.79]KAF2014965.1 hypothetical protein BU24DRAFT_410655 [Aaosphaeria arxii CBS 175.79]
MIEETPQPSLNRPLDSGPSAMEFGAAYLRAGRNSDDDRISMLSAHRESQYQAYRPEEPPVPSSSPPRRSWVVSPVALQQSLPPEPQPGQNSSETTSTLFGSRAVVDFNYQEPVAWANSTQFGPTRPESPKPEPQTTTMPVPDAEQARISRRYFRHPRHIPEPWKAGSWDRFPWCGFFALLLVIALTGASAGLLLASDGSSPDSWKVGNDNAQPQVYISVFEMSMNILILFALWNGMVVRFWREMLHGTTLSAMHDIYESASLWPATKRIVRLQFNLVAVACLLAFASTLRGPLFQRSLTLLEGQNSNVTDSIDIKIALFPIPEYFQSLQRSSSPMHTDITPAFSQMLQSVNSGDPIPFVHPPACGERCNGTVKGFTFAASCTSTSRPLDLSAVPTECKTCSTEQCFVNCAVLRRTELNHPVFSISHKTNITGASTEEQSLEITSLYKQEGTCSGEVQIQTCSLTQVTGEYRVIIANGSISHSDPSSFTSSPEMRLNRTLMVTFWPLAFESLFPSIAVNVTPTEDFSRLQYQKCATSTQLDGSSSVRFCTNGTEPQQSLSLNDPTVLFSTPPQDDTLTQSDPLCSLSWRDPMPSMLSKMRSLAFRITLDMAASDGAVFAPTYTSADLDLLRKDWNQTVAVTSSRTQAVYKTSPALVVLGIVLSFLGVAAVMPLYYGFWELGRQVSLNPLEIARAFGAPLMDGLDGNVTAGMITVQRGGMAVRYGVLERFQEAKKLRIEETARANVRTPWQGEVFG